MLEVRVILHSARDGNSKIIGQAFIVNTGDGTHEKGEYRVTVKEKNKIGKGRWNENCCRLGSVSNYPRLRYNVWRLVIRALKDCFREER